MVGAIAKRVYKIIRSRELNLAEETSSGVLLTYLFIWGFALLRGFCKLRKFTFVEKYAQFRNVNYLKLDKGVKFGTGVIIDAFGREGISIGMSTSIGAYTIIRVSSNLGLPGVGVKIGNNVGIGDFAHIGGGGGVSIGSGTITGSYLSIHPENHLYSGIGDIRLQGVTRSGIVIGSNNWIGAKVTILDGTRVGNNCVIAAGSVLRDVYPDNVLIAGVPAVVKKVING